MTRIHTLPGAASKPGRPSNPTARRFITAFPRALRKPRTTASAGGGHSPRPPRPTPACSTRRAWSWPVSCSASSVRRPWQTKTSAARSADGRPEASGPFALDTLKDDETIARLATGIKRFKLPDEFNPIKIYETIADDPKTGQDEEALNGLATIFENRRQLDRAAQYLERSRVLHGDGTDGWKNEAARPDPRGLGPIRASEDPAGGPGSHGRLSASATAAAFNFEAHEVLVGKLLKDVKEYICLRSETARLAKDRYQRHRLPPGRPEPAAVPGSSTSPSGTWTWSPCRATSTGGSPSPRRCKRPAPTCSTAQMEGGNTSRIVVWLDDTVILKKPLADKAYYFVADARTGQPIPRADVDLFGWRMVQVDGKNEFRVETKALGGQDRRRRPAPGRDGRAGNDPHGIYQWLITARTPEGRFAHLGFTNIWAFGDA